MDWETVAMGPARVAVPAGAIVHVIDEPPDDLSAMRLIRLEGDDVPIVAVMTVRPWQRGWHVNGVVERFARTCVDGSVRVESVDVSGVLVARRLDGMIEMPEGTGTEDDLEAMTLILTRTDRDELVTLTVRRDAAKREVASATVERLLNSFEIGAESPDGDSRPQGDD